MQCIFRNVCCFSIKIQTFFRKSESQRVYQTRSQNYIYPNHRLALTEKGAYYSCICFYNSLPANIKAINNINKFIKSVFQMLVDIEPYNLDEYCRTVSSTIKVFSYISLLTLFLFMYFYVILK